MATTLALPQWTRGAEEHHDKERPIVTLSFDDGFKRDFNAYPDHVAKYLGRLYDEGAQPLRFRQGFPGGFDRWQKEARTALRSKLGLEKIAASVGDHQPVVQLGESEDLGSYTRQRGTIETEPDVRIPFWLLKPKGDGPWPLGVFPHGHDSRGHDTTAGVYADAAHRPRIVTWRFRR